MADYDDDGDDMSPFANRSGKPIRSTLNCWADREVKDGTAAKDGYTTLDRASRGWDGAYRREGLTPSERQDRRSTYLDD